MEMTPVQSSTIKAIGWENNVLYVDFGKGIYSYQGVTEFVYKLFLVAESLGKFFHENIKNKLDGVKETT